MRRYGTFRSRYPQEVFQNLFTALIINNQTELAMGETLTTNTREKLEDSKLGDNVVSDTENISTRASEHTTSYSGYNVEGDFAKNANAANNNHKAIIKSNSINYFDYLTQMNNARFRDTWKHINRELLSLLITIEVL